LLILGCKNKEKEYIIFFAYFALEFFNHICMMNPSLPHTSYFAPFIFTIFFFFSFVNMNAQRLEIHGLKDFSDNETANKAWVLGGAMDIDQLVKKTIFRVDGDWAIYKKRDNYLNQNTNFQRISVGISGLYSINLSQKATFQCGALVNYSNLKHSYISGFDSLAKKPITLQQTGNFIGVGSHLDLRYDLTSRIKFVLNLIPVYLIPVSYKVSDRISDPEYKKGIFLFTLQAGFSFQLYKPD
jgi:hypothetical protein